MYIKHSNIKEIIQKILKYLTETNMTKLDYFFPHFMKLSFFVTRVAKFPFGHN